MPVFYFSNEDLSGNNSCKNFALLRKIVSLVSCESFMQNVGAFNNALRADDVSVQHTGDLEILDANIVLYIKSVIL